MHLWSKRMLVNLLIIEPLAELLRTTRLPVRSHADREVVPPSAETGRFLEGRAFAAP